MDKNKSPLKVALHGMDGRRCKMMAMFLQGPCKGIAIVVNDKDADIDIFDADGMNAGMSLNERLAKKWNRPIIVLSLQDHKLDSVLYIKKPVKSDDMLAIMDRARTLLHGKTIQAVKQAIPLADQNISDSARTPVFTHSAEETSQLKAEKKVLKKYSLDTDKQKKTSKHQAAMQLTEFNFGAFIGHVPGIDVNDPKQFGKASYNPKDYFQGYVESAIKVSQAKGQIRQLNSG